MVYRVSLTYTGPVTRPPHVNLVALYGVGVERTAVTQNFVLVSFVVRTRVQNTPFFFEWFRYQCARWLVRDVTSHEASHFADAASNRTLKEIITRISLWKYQYVVLHCNVLWFDCYHNSSIDITPSTGHNLSKIKPY